jgi:hypothetical protein
MAMVATEQDPEQPSGSSPACPVPAGTAHALDPDAPRTRCGLPASALTGWPEFTWPPTGMAAVDACPACSAPPVGSEHG